jgi:hypothetical protein
VGLVGPLYKGPIHYLGTDIDLLYKGPPVIGGLMWPTLLEALRVYRVAYVSRVMWVCGPTRGTPNAGGGWWGEGSV